MEIEPTSGNLDNTFERFRFLKQLCFVWNNLKALQGGGRI